MILSMCLLITDNNFLVFCYCRFYKKFKIKGTIGAIDCTHIAIVSPHVNDTQTPAHLYMNRKGYYSINVEAVSAK